MILYKSKVFHFFKGKWLEIAKIHSEKKLISHTIDVWYVCIYYHYFTSFYFKMKQNQKICCNEELWDYSQYKHQPQSGETNIHLWYVALFFEWILALGLPRWLSGQEPACQCRRCGIHPWVGKIPWRRKWQHIPRILAWGIPQTEDPGGLQSGTWLSDWGRSRAWLVTSRRFRLPSSGNDRYCFKKQCFGSNGLRLENTPGT